MTDSRGPRRLLTALVAFAMTFSLTMLPGAVQFAHALEIVWGYNVVDDGGSNDPNGDGQNDLTRLMGDESATATFPIGWSWDQPTTIKGGNASNACALFDTDADGNVNYAFCVEVSYTTERGYFITDSGTGADSVKDFPAALSRRSCCGGSSSAGWWRSRSRSAASGWSRTSPSSTSTYRTPTSRPSRLLTRGRPSSSIIEIRPWWNGSATAS
ncbi:hypothetical protein SAMN06266982_101354 [Propioniciclava tarda]|nr:hypothetical protein SAMN06266982_101354 [Propioniciclava tarda]